jgi:Alkylmercury lyase
MLAFWCEAPPVDQSDLDLRQATYATFVDLGRAPTVAEVASELDLGAAAVLAGWRRLHDAHALVLDEAGAEIRMANPFSAVPTSYRVQAQGRWWYANCAWDAFGICACLQVDGRIETSCPDCGDPLRLEVADERPSDDTLLFHTLVPARHWWDDIVFT